MQLSKSKLTQFQANTDRLCWYILLHDDGSDNIHNVQRKGDICRCCRKRPCRFGSRLFVGSFIQHEKVSVYLILKKWWLFKSFIYNYLLLIIIILLAIFILFEQVRWYVWAGTPVQRWKNRTNLWRIIQQIMRGFLWWQWCTLLRFIGKRSIETTQNYLKRSCKEKFIITFH